MSAASLLSLANSFPSDSDTVVAPSNPALIAGGIFAAGMLAGRSRLARVR